MPDTDRISLASFIRSYDITAEVEPADSNPNISGNWAAVHFLVTLHYAGRTMAVPFSGGALAFSRSGGQPTVADVLDSLRSDASSAAQSFEDWAGDYGYDEDSRRAYATWEIVERMTAELRAFMGDAFNMLLDAE